MQKTLLALTFIFSGLAHAQGKTVERDPASLKQKMRVGHARELLGQRYKKIVSGFEKNLDLEKNIHAIVSKRLPKAYQKNSRSIAEAIITESSRHALDPYFVMAVISGESSFNPDARGPVGEIGLMQIRSATGEWMSKKIGQAWKGEKSLKNPLLNIQLGVAYLAVLRKQFSNQSQLYLAAYNMGARSVKNAVGRNVWPKDYPRHVMKRYIAFYKAMGSVKI